MVDVGRRRWRVGVVATVLATAGTGLGAPAGATAVAAAPVRAPAFEPGPCPDGFTDPRVECGTVTVPEYRSKPEGNEVVLAVAVIHPETAESEIAEPPILYLSGGPGDATLVALRDRVDAPLATDRDIVLVDLRGTGASTPSLACPEIDDAQLLAAPVDDARARASYLEHVAECRARLVDAGVDLEAYGTEETAADLVDLRRALDVDEWDVYGISSGGRLALELARLHPDGVRSLVLDSPVAPQGNFFLDRWPRADRAFGELFAACVRSAECNAAHPDLEARFYEMLDRLRDDPVTVDAVGPDGQQATVTFDDLRAVEVLRNAMYDTSLLPIIPGLIDQLTKGEAFDVVASQVLAQVDDPFTQAFSEGEGFSNSCREEVPFVRKAQLARQARELPKLQRSVLDELFFDECGIWDVGRADKAFDRAVRTDLPTLILVGSFDPVTGGPSADAVARTLPNSTVVEFPGVGHGATRAHECPRTVVQQWWLNPDGPLDTSCVDAMTDPTFT